MKKRGFLFICVFSLPLYVQGNCVTLIALDYFRMVFRHSTGNFHYLFMQPAAIDWISNHGLDQFRRKCSNHVFSSAFLALFYGIGLLGVLLSANSSSSFYHFSMRPVPIVRIFR